MLEWIGIIGGVTGFIGGIAGLGSLLIEYVRYRHSTLRIALQPEGAGAGLVSQEGPEQTETFEFGIGVHPLVMNPSTRHTSVVKAELQVSFMRQTYICRAITSNQPRYTRLYGPTPPTPLPFQLGPGAAAYLSLYFVLGPSRPSNEWNDNPPKNWILILTDTFGREVRVPLKR